ncbi:hypothetical protein [Undibacterium sp. TC9W]|uniref:hypothetical protein n=1 Tax=Undibacterium sp. TC9W TaxID=3413053 RepID=UPI003BEFADB6
MTLHKIIAISSAFAALAGLSSRYCYRIVTASSATAKVGHFIHWLQDEMTGMQNYLEQ